MTGIVLIFGFSEWQYFGLPDIEPNWTRILLPNPMRTLVLTTNVLISILAREHPIQVMRNGA